MATPAQIFANRQNAKKSHGATTEAGRQASSKNRNSHGLCYQSGAFTLLPEEDAEDFQRLADTFTAEHQPQTETERTIVRNMIHHEWLRARALRLQDAYFTAGDEKISEKQFALFIRYETTHERGFFKCLRELQNLRKEIRNVAIGLESLKLKESAEQRAVESLELRKQVFELQKEVVQIAKNRAPAAKPPQTDQKMAA